MKTVKKIIIVVGIIVVIPFIIAFLVPKSFKSERSIQIDQPRQQVFEYVRFVRNQDHFGVWQLSDPNLSYTEEGVDGTVGYTYTWDGEVTGKGSQKIVRLVPLDSVITALDFGMGKPVHSYFILSELGAERTQVTWAMEGETPYPFNLFNLFFDVGDDFEEGLQNLKVILEKQDDGEISLHQ